MKLNQFLNQATSNLVAFMRDIVDGSVGGTTNDAVLRFNPANDVVAGDAATIVHSAVNGDSIQLPIAGIYLVEFGFSQAASDEVRLGISQDVAAGGLTGDPAMTIVGMLEVGGALLPAATTLYHCLAAVVRVTRSDPAAPSVIRAHGTDAGGGVVPDAAIGVNTDCFLRVTRVSNFIG